MKFKKPANPNYCANVTTIKTVFQLEKCDNIQGTMIFGNNVIIGKDVRKGDVGIYFPPETQLSKEYCYFNNLFKHPILNHDPEKKGYIEDNRRIRTMKMRGNESVGLFMPLESLLWIVDDVSEFKEGDCFDELNNMLICNKYIIIEKNRNTHSGNKKGKKIKKESKLIENQFRFHDDTNQLGKNIHRIDEHDYIDVSYKLHGTSVIISKVLCKKKLSWYQKFLKLIGADIITTEYSNLWASRRVVKNDDLNINKQHYYKVDIWQLANEKIKDFLLNGMTIYAEIVGFLPDGGYIQKEYDYGCDPGTFKVYIYRITMTNTAGNVIEWPMPQVRDWCKKMGLNAVPSLYYGRAYNIFEWLEPGYSREYDDNLTFQDNLLNILKEKYLDKECYMCKNKLPAEGIVVRKETFGLEAYKYKSFLFLDRETKMLDKGESNIEDDN